MIGDSRGFLFWRRRAPTSEAETAQASYLYCLKLADGGAERHALLRVVGCAVQRGLSDAERLGCDADSPAVQGLLQRWHTRTRDKSTRRTLMHPAVTLWKYFPTAVPCLLPTLFILHTSDLQSLAQMYLCRSL